MKFPCHFHYILWDEDYDFKKCLSRRNLNKEWMDDRREFSYSSATKLTKSQLASYVVFSLEPKEKSNMELKEKNNLAITLYSVKLRYLMSTS